MSSGKFYNVDCELILHYGIKVKAHDEDEAREKAEERLKLIAETQKYKPEHFDTDFGDAEIIE